MAKASKQIKQAVVKEQVQPDPIVEPIEPVEEVLNTAPKPVTLQGKTVNQKIQGKARLFNVARQKIITGWVPIEVANDIVKSDGNIIINDERKG